MIRPACEKDIPQVIALLEQVLMVHYNIRPDLFLPGTTKYSPEELTKIFSDPTTPVFVWADDTDTARGYAFCQLNDYSGHENLVPIKSLYIDDICVDESFRGKGIASELYRYVEKYAKSIGCHNITLCVWEGNSPARSFYEKMGMGIQKTVMETILDDQERKDI